MARDGKVTIVNPLDDEGEGRVKGSESVTEQPVERPEPPEPNPEPQTAPKGPEGRVKGAEDVDDEPNDRPQSARGKDKDEEPKPGQSVPEVRGEDQPREAPAPQVPKPGPKGGDGESKEPKVTTPATAAQAGEETPEQKRIRELEIELARMTLPPEEEAPKVVKSRGSRAQAPKPYEELSEDEKRIRALEHQLAQRRARELEQSPETLEESEAGGEGVLIHFLEDGFTAQGRIWYRGQELEFDPEGRAYEQTKDREGKSWLDLSETDQGKRFGKVYFRKGPWPGDDYQETDAQRAERRRNRAAPVVQG